MAQAVVSPSALMPPCIGPWSATPHAYAPLVFASMPGVSCGSPLMMPTHRADHPVCACLYRSQSEFRLSPRPAGSFAHFRRESAVLRPGRHGPSGPSFA